MFNNSNCTKVVNEKGFHMSRLKTKKEKGFVMSSQIFTLSYSSQSTKILLNTNACQVSLYSLRWTRSVQLWTACYAFGNILGRHNTGKHILYITKFTKVIDAYVKIKFTQINYDLLFFYIFLAEILHKVSGSRPYNW